jgi:hypothetical protein
MDESRKITLADPPPSLMGMRFRCIDWDANIHDSVVARPGTTRHGEPRWITVGGKFNQCIDDHEWLVDVLLGRNDEWYATAPPAEGREIQF